MTSLTETLIPHEPFQLDAMDEKQANQIYRRWEEKKKAQMDDLSPKISLRTSTIGSP
jgi:hypothetical protein